MREGVFHLSISYEDLSCDEWSSKLLRWYDNHRRDLPWRTTHDPYRIWVSEIILQQTRVAQGLDYYHRFLEAFPTVEHLANATEDQVMKLWQGLGYYSRARNMQYAARQIVANGCFPDTYDGVRKLKGVGDYTAAAICSFAFGLPCAVVDGNVYRVLSRFFGEDTPIDTSIGKKRFAALAQSLLPEARLADYNQALMDFGAMQCTPSSPDCASCPLMDACAAHSLHKVDDLPIKNHKNKQKDRYFTYIIICSDSDLWIRKRSGNDIWKGLYEFPLLESVKESSINDVMSHPLVEGLLKQGAELKLLARNLKHILTHIKIHADAYLMEWHGQLPTAPHDYLSISKNELEHFAMPRLAEIIAGKAHLLPNTQRER